MFFEPRRGVLTHHYVRRLHIFSPSQQPGPAYCYLPIRNKRRLFHLQCAVAVRNEDDPFRFGMRIGLAIAQESNAVAFDAAIAAYHDTPSDAVHPFPA